MWEVSITIILSGLALGLIITVVLIILAAVVPCDPDFEDEYDAEIYEHKFWDKKNNIKR
jgi:hypothetical protein